MSEVEPFAFKVQPASKDMALHLIRAAFLGKQLDFGQESQYYFKNAQPPLKIIGAENIPTGGPCVITPNHLFWPGFQAWWMSAAISSVTPVKIHWIMAAAWTTPNRWKSWWWTPLTTMVFRRMATVYGFTTMPPMPPDPKQVEWRARSVREVLHYVHQELKKTDGTGPVVGLVPEGHDFLDGKIHMPPKGVGRFISQLTSLGLSITPVGAFIENGQLCIHFGKAYQPQGKPGLSRDQLDEWVSRQVMLQIACLTPLVLEDEFPS